MARELTDDNSGQVGASAPTTNQPIGQVSEVKGGATVLHTDGTTEPLTVGTKILLGDKITTDADGAVNIKFSDESSFAVSKNADLTIDEYVYDPATDSGAQNFSLARGVFLFTSGLIARDDPDDVQIQTPVGSIGIRGTIIAGDIQSDGNSQITVIEGAIVIQNAQGEATLSNRFETVTIGNANTAPENVGVLNQADMAKTFNVLRSVSPDFFIGIQNGGTETNDNGEPAPAEGTPAGDEPAPQDAAPTPEGQVPAPEQPQQEPQVQPQPTLENRTDIAPENRPGTIQPQNQPVQIVIADIQDRSFNGQNNFATADQPMRAVDASLAVTAALANSATRTVNLSDVIGTDKIDIPVLSTKRIVPEVQAQVVWEADPFVATGNNTRYSFAAGINGLPHSINVDAGASNNTITGGTGVDIYSIKGGGTVINDTGNTGANGDTYNIGNNDPFYSNNNTINAGSGTDTVQIYGHYNTVNAGAGNDIINIKNGSHNNTINADSGNDSITATGSSNTISGGAGNDIFTIQGGTGNIFKGGLGEDTFNFSANSTGNFVHGDGGVDSIFSSGNLSFSAISGIEKIKLTGSGQTLTLSRADLVNDLLSSDLVFNGTAKSLVITSTSSSNNILFTGRETNLDPNPMNNLDSTSPGDTSFLTQSSDVTVDGVDYNVYKYYLNSGGSQEATLYIQANISTEVTT